MRLPSIPLARRFLLSISISLVGLALTATVGELSTLTPIVVNTTLDSKSNDGFCSLREAVIAANSDSRSGSKPGECPAGSGADRIELPQGIYLLTRSDSGKEDSSSTGDLDIKGSLQIFAQPGGQVTVGANAFADRIFHVISGTVSLEGLSVQGGKPTADGGAILNLATLTVLNSTLSGNTSGANGGAISNRGTFTLANVTLSGNQAKNHGGGLSNAAGTATLNNVTITANTADSDSASGGDGGGISHTGGTLKIGNTIVGGNFDNSSATKRPDCSGTISSTGYNLIQSAAGCAISGATLGNLLGFDPQLGILGDNGGTTFTHAPLTGSPVINAASPTDPGSGEGACEPTDQRGTPRPSGVRCDMGAVEIVLPEPPDPPVLIRASGTIVDGLLVGAAGSEFTIDVFSSEACEPPLPGASPVGSQTVVTDALGEVYFQLILDSAIDDGLFAVATATDSIGQISAGSTCIVAGPGNDSWPFALELTFAGSPLSVQYEQHLDTFGQSLWYRFSVQPDSQLIVTLTTLPANYDLTVYKDIAAAYQQLTSTADLERLGAEFAPSAFSPSAFSPSAFSPSAFSPSAFSPSAFSPSAFSPSAFSPSAFSPSAFSPSAFSPSAFSPSAFSPDAWSPSAFSPSAFSPSAFSPSAFSPSAFSPSAFSPSAFSSAQMQSLIGVSAFEGISGEGLVLNTWNNSGDFYVRVRGREGAFSLEAPFTLGIVLQPGSCSNVSADTLRPTSHVPASGSFTTLLLTHLDRMEGTPAEKATLLERLANLAARAEVAGVIVDVGSDNRVADANAQADLHPECPFAKNLVADSIRRIVDLYRPAGLEYVVLIGNDNVIPFFRHPDEALLGPEQQYVPPVLDTTASQASLRLNYLLSQEDYGASVEISFGSDTIPVPDLAVGRLVETAAEATGMIEAYLGTGSGVVPTPTTSLVTGYDFLEDAANAVHGELVAGLGPDGQSDSLIAAKDISPQDPAAWTAADLGAVLLGKRHDLVFLAGHFSAGSALAADYSTSLISTDLTLSSVDLTNAIVFSAGCHSGYNIVNAHGVPGITFEPDWAQAFAQKRATFIGGTGYQYGDTEFLEYSERLYLEFARQLRAGSGPVSVGRALVAAKQSYLAGTPQMRGIHAKAFLEATLFGLPMLQVDMPGARFNPPGDSPVIPGTVAVGADPGLTLGLSVADLTVSPTFGEHTLLLTNYDDAGAILEAFYLSGSDGVLTNPVEPALPLELRNVAVTGTALRGVGFRGGIYTNRQNILPLTGAPTTEIRGVHTPFQTAVFYPVRPWSVNYFDALSNGSDGLTSLATTPAQFRSDPSDPNRGTLRQFNSLDFRLYYSNRTDPAPDGTEPALAAPPTIVSVSSAVSGTVISFGVRVVDNPAAGIQEVWVTYTNVSNPAGGSWQSLDLVQNASDSTLWEGSLTVATPAATRFIVQAANGLGLVSMTTNLGNYYVPGMAPGQGTPTGLAFDGTPPSSGKYGTQATVAAVLTSGGSPVAGEVVTFFLGSIGRVAATDGAGRAEVTLPILALPGTNELSAFYPGTPGLAPSSASSPFQVFKRDTQLVLAPNPATGFASEAALLRATLSEANPNGRTLPEETVIFVVAGPGGTFANAVITDYLGVASLGKIPLPPGNYTVDAYFSGSIPSLGISHSDARYNSAAASVLLTLANTKPDGQPDAYPSNEDEQLNVSAGQGVLSNDTDFDGHPLTARLMTAPSNGVLVLSSDGSFTYSPGANFNGVDTFSYVANDGMDDSLAVVVSISVAAVNDAPIAVDDAFTTDEDTELSVALPGVLENDLDVDLDALTASLVTPTSNGSISLELDGSFTYKPNLEFSGSDSFTYRISDGVLVSNVAMVTLTVNAVNDAPTCGTAFPSSVTLWPPDNNFHSVSILGIADPEGNPFTIVISAVWQDEPVGTSPDAIIQDPPSSVLLRAERDGTGDGRVYHIFFTATDVDGASCQIARVTPDDNGIEVATAPHDQGGDIEGFDGGALFESTNPD
ncbi:MAG TPA: tandem-95 repeat protein [Anaerolineales bacterium]